MKYDLRHLALPEVDNPLNYLLCEGGPVKFRNFTKGRLRTVAYVAT